MPDNNRAYTPYAEEERVFPSVSDRDLWESVRAAIMHAYPERALEEHVRRAFEAVCEQEDEYMLFKDFLRKVTLAWMWKRPPTPRGVVDLE